MFQSISPTYKTKLLSLIFLFKITDMNEFLNDLKSLILKHKKIILLIALVIYVLANYTEVKSGLLDGWNGN